MGEGIKHGLVEGVAHLVTRAILALYEEFGESIVVAALLGLALIPLVRRLFTGANDEGNETIGAVINFFLFFLSIGIALRAAGWAISIEGAPFLFVAMALVAGFAAAFATWWCSFRLGGEIACWIAGEPGTWFRKETKQPAVTSPEAFDDNWLEKFGWPVSESGESDFKDPAEIFATIFGKRSTAADKEATPSTGIVELGKMTHAAAEKGYPLAQRNLGYMYENGCGVEKNVKTAIIWYQKASDQGDPEASSALTRLRNHQGSTTG